MNKVTNYHTATTISGAAFTLASYLEVLIFPEQIYQFALEYDLQLSIRFPSYALAKQNSKNEAPLKSIKGVFTIPQTENNLYEIERLFDIERTETDCFYPIAGEITVENDNGESYLFYRPGSVGEDEVKPNYPENALPDNCETVVRNDELQRFMNTIDKLIFKEVLEKEREEDEARRESSFFNLLKEFQSDGKLSYNDCVKLAQAVGRIQGGRTVESKYLSQIDAHVKKAKTEKALLKRAKGAEDQELFIREKYKQLKKDKPNITKEKAAEEISKMIGISLGIGRIRKALYKKRT